MEGSSEVTGDQTSREQPFKGRCITVLHDYAIEIATGIAPRPDDSAIREHRPGAASDREMTGRRLNVLVQY